MSPLVCMFNNDGAGPVVLDNLDLITGRWATDTNDSGDHTATFSTNLTCTNYGANTGGWHGPIYKSTGGWFPSLTGDFDLSFTFVWNDVGFTQLGRQVVRLYNGATLKGLAEVRDGDSGVLNSFGSLWKDGEVSDFGGAGTQIGSTTDIGVSASARDMRITRVGTTWTLYVNGVQISTGTGSSATIDAVAVGMFQYQANTVTTMEWHTITNNTP